MDQDRTEPTRLVSLDAHRKARRHPSIAQVEAYWEGLRGNRLAPSRAEVDPRGLTGALQHAFVLERIAPGLARFRVAGMHLSDLMGLEVRGMPVSATFTPGSRPDLARALEALFNEPARIRLLLSGETGAGRPTLTGELLLLPLRADNGEISRALGALAMEGQIGRQPRRLEITATEHKTLTGYGSGESSDMAKARPAPSKNAKSAHLRLVHSVE